MAGNNNRTNGRNTPVNGTLPLNTRSIDDETLLRVLVDARIVTIDKRVELTDYVRQNKKGGYKFTLETYVVSKRNYVSPEFIGAVKDAVVRHADSFGKVCIDYIRIKDNQYNKKSATILRKNRADDSKFKESLEECIREQREASARGEVVYAGVLMLEKQKITLEEVNALLEIQIFDEVRQYANSNGRKSSGGNPALQAAKQRLIPYAKKISLAAAAALVGVGLWLGGDYLINRRSETRAKETFLYGDINPSMAQSEENRSRHIQKLEWMFKEMDGFTRDNDVDGIDTIKKMMDEYIPYIIKSDPDFAAKNAKFIEYNERYKKLNKEHEEKYKKLK